MNGDCSRLPGELQETHLQRPVHSQRQPLGHSGKMTSPLSNPTFRTLFAAQIASLMAVGMLTVALTLAAYRIGGSSAGEILGLLLMLKMVAYVVLAPIAEASLRGKPRKPVMICLDLGRMVLLVPMAFAVTAMQLAVLAFLFFALAAAFTPLYQSVIPDVLPEDETYTRALAWSRIAYTLEAILSPGLAAALLGVIAPEHLFLAAALTFAASILALLATRFPTKAASDGTRPFLQRTIDGLRIYRHTPRLRGLLLLNLALSLAMAWLLVNTVVFAGLRLGDAERHYPILMAFYGMGAAAGAVLVPTMIRRFGERVTMVSGALCFAALGPAILFSLTYFGFLGLWAGFGLASSLVLTPGGLVITRSSNHQDRPAVFAAQFSLSHAGWLLAYPLAGWLGVVIGLEPALIVLCGLAAATTFAAARVWPADDPLQRTHSHRDLPSDHPHLRDNPVSGPERAHRHDYHIDDLHQTWGGSSARTGFQN